MEEIENIFDFVRNGASIKQSDGKGGIPITRIETIWKETIDSKRFGYADVSEHDLGKYEKYLLREGDILMTHINSPKHLGKCALYQGKPKLLIHGMNLLCLRPNTEISFPNYLRYYFNSTFFKIQIPKIANQSVNQASFSAGKLKQLQLPLPPLETQKKIASILDAADAYRQKTKALIQKYDELTQSLFLEMFGDTWLNPNELPILKLSEIVQEDKIITYGIVQAGDHIKDGIPYIRTGDIKQGKINIDGLRRTSEEIAKSYERSKCSYGDIVMSIRATVGTTAILPEVLHGANLTQGTARISVDSKRFNPLFIYHSIGSKGIQLKIDRQTKGATFREITLTRLREIEIPIPTLDLQNEFAERVQEIETQKAQAQQSLAKAEDLFNSLLQRAFKGELV